MAFRTTKIQWIRAFKPNGYGIITFTVKLNLDSYQNSMHGGTRPGAGRKPGFSAKKAEEARRYVSMRVAEEIEPLVDVLMEKAISGDLKAMQMLLDRAWGRARQEIQLTQSHEEVEVSPRIIELAKKLNGISA